MSVLNATNDYLIADVKFEEFLHQRCLQWSEESQFVITSLYIIPNNSLRREVTIAGLKKLIGIITLIATNFSARTII